MLNLNLARPEKSDIKFEIQAFPDQQQDIRLQESAKIRHYTNSKGSYQYYQPVRILSRFSSFRDLELILAATAALRRLDVTDIHLQIPYLLGARSDRQFLKGGTSYLVDVVAPILRAQNYSGISVLDPHSDVTAAVLPNLQAGSNSTFVNWALQQITTDLANVCLVSPDTGALKKIYSLAEEIGYTGPLAVGQKHRDLATGNILSTSVQLPEEVAYANSFLIVDDICDGGRTFLELAKAIRAYKDLEHHKIYLAVTHGIFSKGYEELHEAFDGIYCTNSYQQVPVDTYDGYHSHKTGVQCLNVF